MLNKIFKYFLNANLRHNDAKSFLVWVNEEDHMRIIAMQKGGNLIQTYERFYEGLQNVSERNITLKRSKI